MSNHQEILARGNHCCEVCQSATGVNVLEIPGSALSAADRSLALCEACNAEFSSKGELFPTRWFCLKETIWSEVPAVKVFSNLILQRLAEHPWARDLLDQMYLEDELRAWVDELKAAGDLDAEAGHKVVDSNGTQLFPGDSVTLIKDLEVKGANFTAKRGTLVKNINLTDDPQLIEGRVNGTQIVLKTQFLKRA